MGKIINEFSQKRVPHGCLQPFASDPSSEVASKIAEECKSKVTSFKDMLPLISAICNQGLHERHWEKIAEVVGFEIRPDEVTSLRRLLDYGMHEYVKVMAATPCPMLAGFVMLYCMDVLWCYPAALECSRDLSD